MTNDTSIVNKFLLENTDILKSNNSSPILIQAGLVALLPIRTLIISLWFPMNWRSFTHNK